MIEGDRFEFNNALSIPVNPIKRREASRRNMSCSSVGKPFVHAVLKN